MADQIITLKPTSASMQPLIIKFVGEQKIIDIKEKVMEHYEVDYPQVKMIFKGRVLNDQNKLQQMKITPGSIIMLVINKKSDSAKKKELTSSDQTIQRVPDSFNTGMGASMPVGFGGYSLINHPQYMSAMSGAVASQQNMEEFLNDPTYQGMMEELMNDPDTLKQMMQENPMMKNMIKENPQLKMIMDNPELMKMVFNKDTIKMAQQVMKNNKNQENNGVSNPLGGGNPLGGMNPSIFGMNMPGLFGSNSQNQSSSNSSMQPNTSNSNQYQPNYNNFQNPSMGQMGFNPLFMNMWGQNRAPSNPQASQPGSIQAKYSSQMKQLQSMGFKDREQILKALIQSKGDVDGALERLCQD